MRIITVAAAIVVLSLGIARAEVAIPDCTKDTCKFSIDMGRHVYDCGKVHIFFRDKATGQKWAGVRLPCKLEVAPTPSPSPTPKPTPVDMSANCVARKAGWCWARGAAINAATGGCFARCTCIPVAPDACAP